MSDVVRPRSAEQPDGGQPEAAAAQIVQTCRAGHKLTDENLQAVGKAGFRCKECRRRIARESDTRNRRKLGVPAELSMSRRKPSTIGSVRGPTAEADQEDKPGPPPMSGQPCQA